MIKEEIQKYNYFNLWTTPILTATDESYNSIKDKAIEQALSYHSPKYIHTADIIKSRLYESKFDFFDVASEKGFKELLHIKDKFKTAFKSVFLDYFKFRHYPDLSVTLDNEIDLDVDLFEGWVHISEGPGSYHGTHSHSNSSWSAIYCLEVSDVTEETGGSLQFKCPFDNMYSDDGLFFQYMYDTFELRPTNGGMFFFPSNIRHCATPYFGDKTRIVISANMKINFKSKKVRKQ